MNQSIIKKILILNILFELLLFSDINASGKVTYVPGQSYFGRNQYIEYFCGNLPIIISVPHGGKLEPAEIPDRTCGATDYDMNTQELARNIIDAIFNITGKYPHVIINRLHRKKLDVNREVFEATCSNSISAISYYEYQSFIDSAKADVLSKNPRGILIDLHGHGHTIQRLELGYLLTSDELSQSNAVLNTYANRSSVKTLANNSGISFSSLIRGETSLGAFFEYYGYPAVPGNLQPDPGTGNAYFNGGYNTLTHGSYYGGNIDAIQIECNYTGVRDNDANRKSFAKAFSEIILNYFNLHFSHISISNPGLIINEVLFDVPIDNTSTPEIEGDANGDGVRSLRGDEFIEIVNKSNTEADIGGIKIIERNFKTIFTFPKNTVLQPNEYTVVFGGVGPSGFGNNFPVGLKKYAVNYVNADSGFYVSSSKTNLISSNDNVILYDPRNNKLIDEVCWGDAVQKSVSGKKLVCPNTYDCDSITGAIQQSVTRFPEISGLWRRHSQISSKYFSPGTASVTSIKHSDKLKKNNTFQLKNFPNPFNSETIIEFSIPENIKIQSQKVNISVYNILGELIKNYEKDVTGAGKYSFNFNASELNSGNYFCIMEINNQQIINSMILIK